MVDVALGLSIDSSGVDKGIKSLDGLVTSASKAEAVASQLEKSFDRVNKVVANDNSFRRAAEAMKLTSFEARNLGYQLNDVGTMLAMGASPFQIIASQGGQIYQILQGSAGGIKGFGAAIAALLTPVNLLAAGVVAVGAGAAYMVFSTADATDAIEKHAERTKALKAAYDDLVKGQTAVTKSSVAVQEALANASRAELDKKFKSIGASLSTTLQGIRTADIVSGDFTFDAAITRFVQSVRDGKPEVLAFREEVARIANDTSLDDATRKGAAGLLEMTQKAADAEQALYGTADGIQRVGSMSAAQIGSIQAFNSALAALAAYSPDAAKSIEAGKKVMAATADYERGRTALRKELESGAIGGREYSYQLEALNRAYDAAKPGISGVTAEQQKLNDQIDAAKARLSDTSLGARLGAIDADYAKKVEDIRKMSATGATSQEIDGLISKAKQYRDVQVQLAQQADARGGGKTDAELFDELVTRAEGKVAIARVEAQTVGMTAEAIARAKTEQELLNQAKVRDIDLTPAQIERLKMLAGEEARYGEAARKRREELAFEKDITKGFITTLRQSLMSGQNAWESFGNAALSVLDKVINKIETQLVDALFQVGGTSGGGGNLMGGLLGGLGKLLGFANGGAFGAGGVQAFANGGAFTNQIVSSPTLFKFASGAGLMGEAGPEAIMPLSRDGSGRLGVKASIPPAANSNSVTTVMVGAPSVTINGNAGNEEIKRLESMLAADRRARYADTVRIVNDARSRGHVR